MIRFYRDVPGFEIKKLKTHIYAPAFKLPAMF